MSRSMSCRLPSNSPTVYRRLTSWASLTTPVYLERVTRTSPVPTALKAERPIDQHAHRVRDLPSDLVPLVDLDKTLIFRIPPLSRGGVVHLESSNRAHPIEDDFADVPVKSKVGRVG